MSKLTITEALQEIKTITSRLDKKRTSVLQYLVRDARVRDPFESTGGSAKFVKEERQAIGDLEKRIVSIRTAIQRSNLTSPLTVADTTQTVSEWLTWRREVSKNQQGFINLISSSIHKVRTQLQAKGAKLTAIASAEVNLSQDAPPDAVLSVDEQGLIAEIDSMENILGQLDGKLSLFNATTEIDV